MKLLIQNLKLSSLVICLVIAGFSTINAQISVVVSKSSTQQISKEEAIRIFSGTKTTWSNGNKILVVDQSETETGKKFYADYLNKSLSQVRVQWTKLVLSGQAIAPIKAADDTEVKHNVSKEPNAIGYISSKSVDGSVKELFKIE